MNFQEMILSLQRYWAAQGCVIWNPYNVQVGAGTNNPATLLRVLGPEPWRVAYVEPSVRPDDGRYGENPNRMQRFLQYQVILKPEPGNPQELYLDSLAALGIHARENDIRFVEDNWQSPPLGSWGLGWEVWLNGQEISQFTYFQQAAGLHCDPISVEITYGLERMSMAIQGVDSVWDIRWQGELTYGDIYLDEERAHSKYFFEIADVEGLRTVYDTYRREHERALEASAVLPAYDYVLKCNHIFNVLDARGAVGVTERAQFFRMMHSMTRACANAYLAEREALGFPLRDKLARQWPACVATEPEKDEFVETDLHADLLLEIGVEEMPPADVRAVKLLWEECGKLQAQHTEVWVTPRRLVMHQRGVGAKNMDMVIEHRGPPAQSAYDKAGQPTRAAMGFARSKGISTESLMVKEISGRKYVVAQVKRPIQEILTERIQEWFAAIRFPRTMRWESAGTEFSRPIRWVVALWGEQVIPVQLAGLNAGRLTRGHRRDGSPLIEIDTASSYPKIMEAQGIQLSLEGREEQIRAQCNPIDEGLLAEVANLVENPCILRGQFDEKYLQLPEVVLTTVMKKHQRYVPIRDQEGALQPDFRVVCDGAGNATIQRGNEQVLSARFADAEFFYEQDRKQPLEAYLPRLSTLTFHEKLGSMRDKSERLEQLVVPLGELLGYASQDIEIAQQAARLCKADLATQMVIELTSLQGEMGRIYAREDGVAEQVAQAIYEHWLPRFDGDALPQSRAGVLLALADRLDSLVGLFGAGERVRGSADPFGMRRLALSTTRLLIDQQINVPHAPIYEKVVELYRNQLAIDEDSLIEMNVFLQMRLFVWLPTYHPNVSCSEAVNAVMAFNAHIPYRAYLFLQQLMDWVEKPNWEQILDAYARCWRIVPEDFTHRHDESLSSSEAAEHALWEAYGRAREQLDQEKDVDALLGAIEDMLPTITRFFDEVLVMVEDENLRHNRLALLKNIASLADGIVDLSHMPGF